MEAVSEKEMPLVTIFSLFFNTGERLVNTLNSIKNQSHPNIEHIIMDDCSSDTTQDVIREWVKVNNHPCKIVLHDQNKGICKSINEALGMGTGKYFAMIGDDQMLPDKIKDDVAMLESNPGVAFCHSKIIMVDAQTGKEEELFGRGSDHTFHDFFSWKMQIQAPTITYRKSVFDEAGPYDESLLYEDFDMILRITHKFPVGFRDVFTVKYSTNVGSIRINRQKEVVKCSFAVTKKWSFLPNYKYYLARRHLMYFYLFSQKYKRAALPHIPGSLRFVFDRNLYVSFFRLLFRR